MQKRKIWWKSWRAAIFALATVVAGAVVYLLPYQEPQIAEPEAEIYLKQADGHGIAPPAGSQTDLPDRNPARSSEPRP